MVYRDPKLPAKQDGATCECGCGQPHKNSTMVVEVTENNRIPHWFTSQSHANVWRKKKGWLT